MTTTKNDPLPTILYGSLELHGDLFFASLEFHDLVETLPVIHNYALTYALDFCSADNGRKTPLYWATERRKQQPHYLDDFGNLMQADTYVTPARSSDGLPPTVIRQYATRVDEYLHFNRKIDDVLSWESNPKKRTAQNLASIFPMHGYMKLVAVGARFLFYIYNPPTNLQMQRFIRLGKFNTKAAITLARCSEVSLMEGGRVTTHPINPQDVTGAVPLNLLTMRPTPLVMAAQLADEVLQVTHPNPWQTSGKPITTYLPRSPRYGKNATGTTDVTLPDRSSKTTPKRRTRR